MRYALDKGVFFMTEITCISCGKPRDTDEKWMTCPNCGCNMCHNCGIQEQKEKKEIDKLRKGDPVERLQVTCPKCGQGMIYL